jgi:hypothetical protein
VIFYNWEKMYLATQGNSSAIITLIANITYPTLPKNVWDPIYRLSQQNWGGNSFLLYPEKIISNRSKFGDTELAQYVALASFRSFAEYQATNKRSLNMLISPVSAELINNHRLLSLVEEDIFFCWEEVTH